MSKYILPINISTLKLTHLGIAILFISAQMMLSCDSDDEKIICRIISVNKWTHLEDYTYNSENKVETIGMHFTIHNYTGKLEYNTSGQLIKYTVYEDSAPDKPFHIHEFVYDGEMKPQKAYYWGKYDNPSARPAETVEFYHDEKDRLVGMKFSYPNTVDPPISRRFEYNSEGNVGKVFLTFDTDPEFLMEENLTFDHKPTLYAQSPELAIIDVYINLTVPEKNNVITGKYYLDSATSTEVTYEATYDDNGLIASYERTSEAGRWNSFSDVKRECN